MGFAGDGGPPPESSGGGGFNKKAPMFSFYETVKRTNKEGELKEYQNRVHTWYVPVGGKDKPLLMLDPSTNDRFACLIHVFIGPDGKKGSMIRCVAKARPEQGCPVCAALDKDATWYWALTAIDRSKWSPKEGKNKDKVYSDSRKLVLVTSQQYKDMEGLEEKEPGGWRGRSFDVSRSDAQKSYKIGTGWYPTNPGAAMTDEEMYAEFAERAKDYGLAVEEFCAPFPYDQTIPLLSHEELVKAAAKIKGTDAEVPTGDTEAISF